MDMSGLLMIGSVALKDGRPINRGNTSEYEHDRVFVKLAVRAIEKTLSDVGRSVLGELLAPGERTLHAAPSFRASSRASLMRAVTMFIRSRS